MLIELPFMHKILWPNGRTKSHRYRRQEIKKHRNWAYIATKAALAAPYQWAGEKIEVRITLFPKPSGPAPDEDNIIAACKSYLDGIADALGVNDRNFAVHRPVIGERRRFGAIQFQI